MPDPREFRNYIARLRMSPEQRQQAASQLASRRRFGGLEEIMEDPGRPQFGLVESARRLMEEDPTAAAARQQEVAANLEAVGASPEEIAAIAGQQAPAPAAPVAEPAPAPEMDPASRWAAMQGGIEEPVAIPTEAEPVGEDPAQELERLRMWKSIAESGGQIGRGLAKLSGTRADFGEKFRAPELERQVAEKEVEAMPENQADSPMSMQLRELISEATGTSLDEGLTFNQMEKLAPYAAAQVKAQQAPVGKPLAGGEVEKLGAAERSIADFEELEAGLEDFQGAIGPVDARLGKISEVFGVANPQLAAYRAKVTRVLNRYIKEMTGAQMSAQEAERLLAGLQNPKDADDVFAAKLTDVMNEARRNYSMMVSTYRRAGRDVSGFEGGTVGRSRRFRVPGRPKPYTIPADQVDAFLADYPEAEEL